MPEKETTSELSSLAGAVMGRVSKYDESEDLWVNGRVILTVAELRSLCGSVLSQDETEGQDPPDSEDGTDTDDD